MTSRADKTKTLTGIVSIHDAMPETLPQIRGLIAKLRVYGVDKITLLVVPGKQWTEMELLQLKQWESEGLKLAGHGWSHRADKPRSLYHRLHSILLSRLAAEHLSLQREQIATLMRDCFDWFAKHNLTAPTLYVPPAWALGALPRSELNELPFQQVELLAGVVESSSNSLRRLPLTGYEADTGWRAFSLGYWNKVNLWRARSNGTPLRIGIHPFDDEFRLREQMAEQIQTCERFIDYDELFTGTEN